MENKKDAFKNLKKKTKLGSTIQVHSIIEQPMELHAKHAKHFNLCLYQACIINLQKYQ